MFRLAWCSYILKNYYSYVITSFKIISLNMLNKLPNNDLFYFDVRVLDYNKENKPSNYKVIALYIWVLFIVNFIAIISEFQSRSWQSLFLLELGL